jgi:stage V sporulation protein S
MNRFFSKLDLRDIKIDPEGSRFPPDADEQEAGEESTSPRDAFHNAPVINDADEDELQAESSSVDASPNENHYAPVDEVTEPDSHNHYAPADPVVESNGHLSNGELVETSETPFVETTTTYQVDGEVVGVVGEVLKVSARSRPSAVAGAIAGVVREAGRAEVQAIGAGATNQAVKAVAIARDYLRETGIEAVCVPAFIDVTIDNEDRTAIRLVVEPR